ncbi:unnamed protein product, partial [Trichogramma brassicae]
MSTRYYGIFGFEGRRETPQILWHILVRLFTLPPDAGSRRRTSSTSSSLSKAICNSTHMTNALIRSHSKEEKEKRDFF